jgi:hypothetical protein
VSKLIIAPKAVPGNFIPTAIAPEPGVTLKNLNSKCGVDLFIVELSDLENNPGNGKIVPGYGLVGRNGQMNQ